MNVSRCFWLAGLFSLGTLALLSCQTAGRGGQGVRRASGDRLGFSGYSWIVVDDPELRGPGPNYFDRRNVGIDAAGRLVLQTALRDGRWTSAHVFLERSFGYGHYELVLAAIEGVFDPLAVFGFFTWDDDPAYANREIDIELAQWGQPDAPVLNFVVQPAEGADWRVMLADLDLGQPLRLSFDWRPEAVYFRAESGERTVDWRFAPEADSRPFAVPPAGNERIGINLWLFQGRSPAGPSRVVIEKFSYRKAE